MPEAKVNALRERRKGVILQPAAGEELHPFFGRTLLPSVLDRALRENYEDPEDLSR